MSTRIGKSGRVYSLGEHGMRVSISLGNVEHAFEEDDARRIHDELGRAIDLAWPLVWRTFYAGPLVCDQGVSKKWNALASAEGWTILTWDGLEAYHGKSASLTEARAACEDVARRRARGEVLSAEPRKYPWLGDE